MGGAVQVLPPGEALVHSSYRTLIGDSACAARGWYVGSWWMDGVPHGARAAHRRAVGARAGVRAARGLLLVPAWGGPRGRRARRYVRTRPHVKLKATRSQIPPVLTTPLSHPVRRSPGTYSYTHRVHEDYFTRNIVRSVRAAFDQELRPIYTRTALPSSLT